jgi:hypothetical protein
MNILLTQKIGTQITMPHEPYKSLTLMFNTDIIKDILRF